MTARRVFEGDTFRSLHSRNLRVFLMGQAVSQIGYWLRVVSMTLLVFDLTDSGVALGLLAAFQYGPLLLLGQLGGLTADRSDKQRLLLSLQGIGVCISAALAVLSFQGDPPLAAIYALGFASGTLMAFDSPARRSYVGELAAPEDMQNAVGLNTALITTARIIGPALAGALIATVGYGWCFTLDSLSFLAVVASLLVLRSEDLQPPEAAPRGKGQVREGLRYIRRTPVLFLPMVMSAVVGMFAFNFQTVLPLLSVRDLGGSDTTYTVLYSVLSVGAVAGALSVARRRDMTVHRVAVISVWFGISMMVFALAPNLPTALLIGCVAGYWSIAFFNATTAILQIAAAPEMRGRVLALQMMLFLGSTPVGAPIVGAVSEAWGARYGVGIGAVAALGAGTWGLLVCRRTSAEDLRHPEPSAATAS